MGYVRRILCLFGGHDWKLVRTKAWVGSYEQCGVCGKIRDRA